MSMVQAPTTGQDSPYCTAIPCICGRNCHDNPEYHLQVTRPPVNTDESAIQTMLSNFTTADPADDNVWRWKGWMS